MKCDFYPEMHILLTFRNMLYTIQVLEYRDHDYRKLATPGLNKKFQFLYYWEILDILGYYVCTNKNTGI